jgi:hypothetical protein
MICFTSFRLSILWPVTTEDQVHIGTSSLREIAAATPTMQATATTHEWIWKVLGLLLGDPCIYLCIRLSWYVVFFLPRWSMHISRRKRWSILAIIVRDEYLCLWWTCVWWLLKLCVMTCGIMCDDLWNYVSWILLIFCAELIVYFCGDIDLCNICFCLKKQLTSVG